MRYAQKKIDEVMSDLSDLGWEKNSVEFDIDMLPDDEECPMAIQERNEISAVFEHEHLVNKRQTEIANKQHAKWLKKNGGI